MDWSCDDMLLIHALLVLARFRGISVKLLQISFQKKKSETNEAYPLYRYKNADLTGDEQASDVSYDALPPVFSSATSEVPAFSVTRATQGPHILFNADAFSDDEPYEEDHFITGAVLGLPANKERHGCFHHWQSTMYTQRNQASRTTMFLAWEVLLW